MYNIIVFEFVVLNLLVCGRVWDGILKLNTVISC